MQLRSAFIAIFLAALALFLGACTVVNEARLLLTPLPTLEMPGDPQVTVEYMLTATAGEWTPSPTATRTAEPAAEKTPLPTASQTPAPTHTPSPTPTPSLVPLVFELPVNVGPFNFPSDVNPLTGLKVSDPALLDRRPLAIKITNYPRRVRPQSGISMADLVYEYYIENGLTRFIAVFYGQNVDRVGPIRSGRFFDEHIVRMYNAIFAFASADRRVLEPWLESDLLPRLVIPRPDNCPPMCRDQSNPDYNNLYTNTEQLALYAMAHGSDNNRYDLSGMRFQSLTPWGGSPADQLNIRYSRLDFNAWQYDPGSGRYLRYQDIADDNGQGEQYAQHFDGLTGQPVSAANVVVLMLPHEEFVKSSDTEVFKLHLQGAGRAFVFRDGQAWEAAWARSEVTSPLQVFRAGPGAGTHFPLKPGNTFFQVIGVDSAVLQNDSSWRFNFGLP